MWLEVTWFGFCLVNCSSRQGNNIRDGGGGNKSDISKRGIVKVIGGLTETKMYEGEG